MIASNIRGVGNRTVKLFNPAVAARLLFQPGLNLKTCGLDHSPVAELEDNMGRPRSFGWPGLRPGTPVFPVDQADLRQGNIIETRCL